MGRIAFVFAGQGAQFPGMGSTLFESSPASAEVFQKADIIRPGTSEQCFHGTDEELKETKNTQPCMFAVELAAAAALKEKGITADCAAGFSLGEVAAVTWAGMLDFDTGFRMVCRRGEHMQKAAEKFPTAMAAVVKLSNEKVIELCSGFEGVYPVNFNCPGQVSVSGPQEAMADLSAAVKAAGGRAIPLKVRGGFHSPYMEEASESFAADLASCNFREPEAVVYSNFTAQPYSGDPAKLLSMQISHPVLWEKIIRSMLDNGVDTFIELGPGKTLCGLIAKIEPSARTFNLCSTEDLQKICAEVSAC